MQTYSVSLTLTLKAGLSVELKHSVHSVSKKFTRYNATWDEGYDALKVEMECIRKGGRWKGSRGQECGIGLLEHFKNARKLIWPDRYWHRWTELIYSEYLKNIVTILMGPGSAQKTSGASECVLIDYWSRPNDTLVLVSTVNKEKLNAAVFGEIKMLHQAALLRHPWLAGHLIESQTAIATDDLEENGTRDIRKGVIGKACYVGHRYVGLGTLSGIKQKRIRFVADELQFMQCFPSGTLVDTNEGPKPIESIRPGNSVISAIGPSKVSATSIRLTESLVKIKSKDGRIVYATPEHPFFTQKGWKKALELNQSCYMVGTNEGVSILRGDVSNGEQESGLQNMQDSENDSGVQVLPKTIQEIPIELGSNILRQVLLWEVDANRSRSEEEVFHFGESKENRHSPRPNAQGSPGICGGFSEAIHGKPADAQSNSSGEDDCSTQRDWSQAKNSRREWNGSNPSGTCVEESDSRAFDQRCGENRYGERVRVSYELQAGLGNPGIEAWRRGGREFPFNGNSKISRRQKDDFSHGSWVDNVEVLKQEDIERLGGGPSGIEVHNLQVEGHPSYSVSGFLVHNSTFFDCLPNMFQSADLDAQGDPDVKVVGSGNPKHDPDDMLSRAAEPEGGWASLGDIQKTTVWTTNFHRGVCVNLIGSDSPNNDVPEGERPPFPRLISRNSSKLIEKKWGKNSMQYYSQCVGKMMMNMVGNRVITKELCEQHQAFEDVIWMNDRQTRIGFLDPAWGGVNADRCVWGWLEFGTDVTGKEIMRFGEYIVVPFAPNSTIPPDDQIAQFVQIEARKNGIETTDIFYDSTGRGTIGAAMARVFGFNVPVPVAFGDMPSKRPVRHDLFVEEEDGSKRLKRCDEEYRKFVTELWFSARHVIECDQMRNLPEEVAREGYMREYQLAPGGKIEVETKDETRERMGMSPDLFDAYVVGVEGARQRGFKIGRLGQDLIENQPEEAFFEEETKQWNAVIRSNLLERAA